LRKAAVLLALFFSLSRAFICSGEDRTEVIKSQKGSKELVYRDDSLAEERSFDMAGSLLEEKTFGPDSLPTSTSSYIREEGRLARVEARDASGVIIGSRDYHYDRNGRLLGVSASGSLGDGAAGMVSSGGTPQGSWTEAGSTTTVLSYDETGKVVVSMSMKEGKTISIERRMYGEGGILSSIVTEDKVSGSSSELLFDEQGRQSQRREIPAKGIETATQYRYDESGRLLEELKRVGSHATSIRRTYAEDGKLARVETRRDGQLMLAIDYVENGRVEELYDDGILFVKASFVGGRKVKDEFYSEGVLVRARDYR
jgi:antitoxin component YwqK of YwqJK toxin-antitoxin module